MRQFNRQEKECFLELAYQIANCDQNFSEKERELIMNYRKETRLSESDYQIKKEDIGNLISLLNNATTVVKHAVIMELLALCKKDNEYHDNERELMERMGNFPGFLQ